MAAAGYRGRSSRGDTSGAMATAAEPRPASLPLPGGREGATVRLHPLLTGALRGAARAGSTARRAGWPRCARSGSACRSDELEIPILAFLVEHPGAGPILIDTGFHPSVAVDPQAEPRPAGRDRLHADVDMEPSQAASAQLRARGIDPGDVRSW